MATSDIYTIPNWVTSTSYAKNDIVLNGSDHYYSTSAHTSGTFATDLAAGKWKGVLTYGGQSKPHFFWKASYDWAITTQPKVKKLQFGDGYIQELKDGISNILLSFDLNFNERSLAEHKAIIHFLHEREGKEKFFFVPPQPYGNTKKFICSEWNSSQTFIDNYNIKARFEERV